MTLKIGHCFLLSKYKNTFIWIKMYTVENSSMHSLGVRKRLFWRVCAVFHWLAWRLQPGLGAWKLRFLERPSIVPFWSVGFTGLVSKCFQHPLNPVSYLSPWQWIGTDYGPLFFIILDSVREVPNPAFPQSWKRLRNKIRREIQQPILWLFHPDWGLSL